MLRTKEGENHAESEEVGVAVDAHVRLDIRRLRARVAADVGHGTNGIDGKRAVEGRRRGRGRQTRGRQTLRRARVARTLPSGHVISAIVTAVSRCGVADWLVSQWSIEKKSDGKVRRGFYRAERWVRVQRTRAEKRGSHVPFCFYV